jgi:hypothetical protein
MVAFPEPRRWTREELSDARIAAIGDFVAGRNEEGGESYAAMLTEAIAAVERLFVATDNLRAVEPANLVATPLLVAPLRHTAGPPISEDDLSTMAGVRKNPRVYLSTEAEAIIAILAAARDQIRLPWLNAGRESTETERWAAILATATLWATQQMATKRRNESADRQEAAVRALLTAEGFREIPTRRSITNIDDLARGEFCAECEVVGTKADVCIRLHNGRLLLIECKVSGSALNSVKRLLHDIGDKAAVWRAGFGAQAIPMGVIAGVFKLKNLEDAQTKGIAIVWERDLSPLAEFVRAAR